MKMTRKFAGTLAMMGFMVFIAGCRPTIEFKSNSTTAAPGETVTLEWEVEFAKGTSSSKVTITDLGEVEPEGTGEVVVDETKDFQLRVSTFVLGMPITSKQSLTINVPEDNFKLYQFEDGTKDGWDEGYVFYDVDDRLESDRLGVLCWDTMIKNSSFNLNVAAPGGDLGDSLKFCSDNDASSQDEESRYNMAYIQTTISDGDDFEIERNTRYKIGYEITMGVKFDQETCEDVPEILTTPEEDRVAVFGNLHLVLGAAKDRVGTYTDDDIVKLKMEEFLDDQALLALNETYSSAKSSDDYPVDGPQFVTAGANADSITIDSNLLKGVDIEEDIEEGACDDSSGMIDPQVLKTLFKGISDTNYVYQTANDDRELQLFIGLLNTTDEKDIEFFIDTVRVQIFEEKATP